MRSTLAKTAILCCALLAMITFVGCAANPLASGMAKVASGNADTLTGAEVQALVGQFAPGTTFTTEQANAIAQFLADAHVKTMDQIGTVMKLASSSLDSLTPTDIQNAEAILAPDDPITAEQAATISQFLTENDIKTVAELEVMLKVEAGQMDSLTAADIKALAALFPPQSNTFTAAAADQIVLTDEQCAAIAEALAVNHVKTLADLQALLQNPGSIVLPEGFVELLSQLLDVSQLPPDILNLANNFDPANLPASYLELLASFGVSS